MQQFSTPDRFKAQEMAAAMRNGLTTREDLVPLFGRRNVDRLGALATELAVKAESAVH